MLKAIVVVLIYLVFFSSVACLTLPMGTFRSFEEKSEITKLPMSDTDPVEYLSYHPTVYIQQGQLIASQSDYFIAGPYKCKFGTVVVYPVSTPSQAGFMPILGLLLWNGEWYLNMTQLQLLVILLIVGMMIRALYRRGWLQGIVRQRNGNPTR